MSEARTQTTEQLMTDMDWVRRLARALVRNDAVADDVAQDAWVVAAERQPDTDRPLRPWLSRVVVNLVRTRRRGDHRRGEREASYQDQDAGARADATPAELVERVELQRIVAGEVLALDEPYRTTVLLHFVEGLTSMEIAQRTGTPDGTVRRRLKTALDQLRARLDERTDQPRRGWLAALAPLAHGARPSPVLVGGIVVKKLIAALAVLAVLIACALLWKLHRSGRGNHGTNGSDHGSTATRATVVQHARWAGQHGEAVRVPDWASQVGAPARRIAGHVVADEARLAGATVLLGLALDDGQVQPLAETTTAADGSFDFGVQPAARFRVSAQAESRSSATVEVANMDPQAKPDAIVLALGDCRSRIYGTVSDASGGGIAKARLSLDGLSGVESDASGHYSLCLTPIIDSDTSVAVVHVEADGYGAAINRVLLAGELHTDFVLVPEAVLVGRVVGGDDRPVAGARVVATPDALEGPHHVAPGWTESDGDGRFRIAGLSPGKFHLAATSGTAGTATPLITFAQPTTTSKELRLVVASLARITGRVVMNGVPVASARVTATRPSASPFPEPGPSALSQTDGTFTLDGVPLGTMTLSAPPFAVTTPKQLVVDHARIDGVELEVGKLATLRGHVLRKGKPVPGASVKLLPMPPPPVTVTTDADGAYVIEGLAAGDAQLYAWSAKIKAYTPPRPIHIVAGKDRTEDLELDRAGEVKGTVVDEAGKPVASVCVRLNEVSNGDQCEAMSDGNGNFDCVLLIGGEYLPRVSPTPASGQEMAPAVGATLPTISVPQDGVVTGVRLAIKHERVSIRGVVLDDTGTPVPDVHVEAIGHSYPVTLDLASVMSNANGVFEITNLARGTYSVHAHAADGSETEVLGIAAASPPITITLARPGAIDGTLVGFSSTPFVETSTLTADLHMASAAIVEGNHFSAVGLPPGKYTVEAKTGLETDGVAVDVRPGETTHVTLTNRGTGTLEGVVSEFGTKTPVAGMRCDANLSMGGQMGQSPPDESRQAYTDAAGHFRLAAPTGRVRVFCFNPTGGLLSVAGTDVDVNAGSLPHVELFAVRAVPAPTPANFGFDVTPLNLPLTVNTVEPGSIAAAAGVHPGDQLVTIDGAPLQGVLPAGAMVLLMNHKPGSTATLGLVHGGVAHTIKLTLPPAPTP